ncbi:PAS domain S-box protein [Adhaeribacter sp. BT258]|uniref:histidine kinase n=1 Tax=Adhaeribacter terrigena TaxID=2793070 RepID=A0ABS1C0V0_9BACT|nr:PAS domain S-box protein [Adhaeribacter terrigena]MBK0403030.1 PAS domain S-box protein [Adhaeribacter terrigena]
MELTEYTSPTPKTYRRLRLVSRILCVLVVLIACLTLIGWLVDLDFLKRRPDSVAMNPFTALGLIAAAIALYLRQERNLNRYNKQANMLAYFMIGLGALKLLVLVTGLNFPFDQILFSNELYESRFKITNSIPPNTAINFILLGSALIFINYETNGGRRPSQYLAILSSLLALISLYGYVYGISTLYTVTTYLPMTPQTAACFLFLSAGILFARPDKGSMAIVIGESSSQIIFMRFLALVLPLILGWLKLKGEEAGYYSKEAGTAMFAVLAYVFAMYLLARRSVLQHKIRETKRIAMDKIKENERRLQEILDHSGANISVKTTLGKYTLVNKHFEKDFGRTSGNILGKTDYDLFPKEIARELNQYDHQIIKTGQPASFEEKYLQQDGIHTYITVKFPLFTQDQKIYALGAVSTDITHRKKLEEELRISEERYALALHGTNDGLWDWDLNNNYLFLSTRWKQMLGYGAEEIPHTIEAWEGLIHPDDREKTLKVIEDYFEKKLPVYEVEFRMRHKDGSYRWMLDRGMAIWDEAEKPYRMVGYQTDLTERKRLEEELRKSHQRLFSILDNVGEGVIVVDKDGNLLIFNRQAEEILGTGAVNVPLEEWHHTYGFYKSEALTYFSLEENPLFKALKGETADNVEMLVKNSYFKEGKWIAVTGRPVIDIYNEVIAGVIVFREITQRKKLEKRFQENEKRLKLILTSIGEGVIIMNTEEQILLFNKKAEELLGTGPWDLPLKQWPGFYGIYEADGSTLFPAENLPLARALQGFAEEETEVLIRNKQFPEGRHIFLSGKPIRDNNGKITGAILDLKDITEQRKLEEYLKEIQDQFYELLNQQKPPR